MARDTDPGTQIMKSPVRTPSPEQEKGEACMILLHPPGAELGRRAPLSRDYYLIGRDSGADIIISRDSVSRTHAELKRDARGDWVVKDLGSTNGTFVNEGRVEREHLRDGDQVRFGDAIYKFLEGSNIESAYHEEIYRMTIIDGLTGVHNKRYFLDFLERELASAHRHQHPLSLVLFDIDHFKRINDDHGHLCGDEILKQIAGRIKPRIRREDLFARYGGEEFATILTVTGTAGGVTFAEALRKIVERDPFEFQGELFEVTVSLGVSTFVDEPEMSPEELIRRTDELLYEAKRAGRNRVIPSPDSLPKP